MSTWSWRLLAKKWYPDVPLVLVYSVQTRRIERQVDVQGVFARIGNFIICEGFRTVIPREQVHLRKSKPPRNITRELNFSELRVLQCAQFAHC